jgi:3-methyl-2-oxobutanoate hydroxymethyltransferase
MAFSHYGFPATFSGTAEMAMMNHRIEAVARKRPRALIVADMPFLSFHLGIQETIRKAGEFLQRGAVAVRLEGGAKRVEVVRALLDCDIPVIGYRGAYPATRQCHFQGAGAGKQMTRTAR